MYSFYYYICEYEQKISVKTLIFCSVIGCVFDTSAYEFMNILKC